MNNNELPDDDLLQFLFGEGDEASRAAARKAVECDARLADDAQELKAVVAAVRDENVARLGDDFNDRLRQRMSEVEGTEEVFATPSPLMASIACENLLRPPFRSLVTWRWIMRSPVSRVAAAVILVLAVAGVVCWFHTGGTAPVYADFLKPILEAKTARYKTITEVTGANAAKTTTVVMMLGPSRTRSEMEIEMSNLPKTKLLQIWDGYKGKQLSLEPEHKRATVFDYIDRPKDTTPKDADPLAGWRSVLLDARKKPDLKREPLGEKDIDGVHVIGFRVTTPTATLDVWGDPKTGTPVRMDMTTPLMANVKMTMRDFELNVQLDESLFSVEPPAGYKISTVRVPKTNDPPPGEKDLLETLRCYTELSGGTFPDLLDRETLTEMLYGGLWLFYSLDHSPTSSEEKHQKEHYAVQKLFDRGLEFVVFLPKQCDAHYAGRRVSLGAADTPVFWYRPKGAKNYRVVYADLAVREAETPPSMSVVQPGQPEEDLIEMLREYSQWNGGTLPKALGRTELIMAFRMKGRVADVPAKQNWRSSEEWKKIAAARLKIERGMDFVLLLPKEADWHYAGKRVALGAVDTPVFWYRPKGAKKYRVIYADLAVREAETPPSTPYVLPEQDLIDMFRQYGEHVDGQLPNSLDLMKMMEGYGRKIAKELFLDMCTPPNGKLDEMKRRKIEEVEQALAILQEHDPKKKLSKEEKAKLQELSHKLDKDLDSLVDWEKVAPGRKNLSEKQKNHYKDVYGQKFMEPRKAEIIEGTVWIQSGLAFVGGLLPEADVHYVGKGVKLGAADKPIFWYRPKGAKKYRVIYADLTVREADTPPKAGNAQAVPRQADLKK
jgi:hypothetical protein